MSVPVGDTLRKVASRLGVVSDQPEQEARWLVEIALGCAAAGLLCRGDQPLPATAAQWLDERVERRLAGLPLPYCLGTWSFYGLEMAVNPAVLIPRPDTESLVELALGHLPREGARRVLDLGTGSGAVALAVARARPEAEMWAVERSPEALAVAQGNGRRLGLAVHWLAGDWFAPLPPGLRFDLILANPPYLAADDPHLPALRHEPQEALLAGPTGLECLAAIATAAPGHLVAGGVLGLEHGAEQGEAVRALFRAAGFGQPRTHRDLAGRERVTSGSLPA
ncbi:peptide chain release factor N(5)-glutamine methyltransferase [Acidithiobacillus sulfuriphilus]|uniref:peptide chain release factor N(5)-glutamine methyltransferase n=1 Tax=Acidithiobacillus sulfuriphilus TaxID=1867749 RepID=UPI003F5ECB89